MVWGVKYLNITFWSKALNYELKRMPDEDFYPYTQNRRGVQLSLKLTTSEKPKRHHIDLINENQKEEVDRLINLGATRMNEWDFEFYLTQMGIHFV